MWFVIFCYNISFMTFPQEIVDVLITSVAMDRILRTVPQIGLEQYG